MLINENLILTNLTYNNSNAVIIRTRSIFEAFDEGEHVTFSFNARLYNDGEPILANIYGYQTRGISIPSPLVDKVTITNKEQRFKIHTKVVKHAGYENNQDGSIIIYHTRIPFIVNNVKIELGHTDGVYTTNKRNLPPEIQNLTRYGKFKEIKPL